MKFSIDRDSFAKLLKKVDGVCAANGTFQILSNCLIEAADNKITLTGTDLTITIRSTNVAQVFEEGRCLVPEKRLSDTINSLETGASVNFSTDGSTVTIESGKYKSRIPQVSDITEYPKIEEIEVSNCVSVSAQTFKETIDKIYFSISTDETRPDFTGGLLSVSENGHLQIVSTDGHRLSRVECDVEIGGKVSDNLVNGTIVPRKALNELSHMLSSGVAYIDFAQKKFAVRLINDSEEYIFCVNPINGQFPDFSKVIPAALEHKAVIRREDLAKMLQRASIYASKNGTIRLSLMPGHLEISSYDHEYEMNETIDVEYDGQGVTTGFNWRYISDILKVIGCDIVSFEIIDMDSPAVIRDVTTTKLDYIVMPMQL